MGIFFSVPETLPLEAQAASESGSGRRGERDGRSYAEVVRAGREPAWKFVAAPTDEEIFEHKTNVTDTKHNLSRSPS